MEGMIAEMRMFGGNFAPRSWALCQGQILPISSNTALFSLIGTTYGGDGRTTFALPDLRGRAPLGEGTGPGLTPRRLGERGGQQTVVLTITEIPSHNHIAEVACFAGSANTKDPTGNFIAGDQSGDQIFNTGRNAVMNTQSVVVGNTGGTQSHNNMQPYLCVHYIIALQGVFPSRN